MKYSLASLRIGFRYKKMTEQNKVLFFNTMLDGAVIFEGPFSRLVDEGGPSSSIYRGLSSIVTLYTNLKSTCIMRYCLAFTHESLLFITYIVTDNSAC